MSSSGHAFCQPARLAAKRIQTNAFLPPHGLPRSARVRLRREYTQAFAHGRRFSGSLLILHIHHSAVVPRLGLAVSRKVDPKAVNRNRIKRVLRETIRHRRLQLKASDYIIVARRHAASASNEALRVACEQLLHRAGALPTIAGRGKINT